MPVFTRETAAAHSAKAAEGRRLAFAARRQAHIDALAKIDQLQAALAALQTETSSRCIEDYAGSRLSQVREQLDRITALLAKETDPLSVERLARAMAALSTQEFALAGRPLPGSLRPTAAAARKSADYRNTLSPPASPTPAAPINPFRRAGQ